MSNISSPFTTQNGISGSTATVTAIVFDDNTQQTTAFTGTGTLVAKAVNAQTADYATTFNTGTLVAKAVNAQTADYATTFNTGTLVAKAVNAQTADYASTSTLNNGTWTVTLDSIGNLTVPQNITFQNGAEISNTETGHLYISANVTIENTLTVQGIVMAQSGIQLTHGATIQNTATNLMELGADELLLMASGQTVPGLRITPGNSALNTGEFKISDEGAYTEIADFQNSGVSISAPLVANGGASISGLTYPTSDGSAGQFITTDGGGNLSWGTGGSGFVYVTAADTTTTNTATGIVLISDNGNHVAYYNSTVSNWLYVGTDAVVYSVTPPAPTTPPVTDYVAWYDMTSVSLGTNTWTDKSANGHDATISAGVSVTAGTGHGATETFDALTGGTSDSIGFPYGLMNSTYTVFHVIRYNNTINQNRILTDRYGAGNNWLSGHHDKKSGVAYHNGWVNSVADHYGINWVISSDQNYFYRPNGNTGYQGTSGGGGYTPDMGINIKGDESSDWQAVELIMYDRTLSGTEISDTETYLGAKYGITLG